MLTRRTAIQAAVAALIAPGCARAMFPRGGSAASQSGATFDYFIAPAASGGSMSNTGTSPSSPWTLAALWEESTTYGGKNVGLIAGNYGPDCAAAVANWVTYCNSDQDPNPYQAPFLPVQGSASSSNPTYIASCDSSGNYSARAAVLDFHPTVGSLGVAAYITGVTILNSTQISITVNAPSANSSGTLVNPFAVGDTLSFYQIAGMTGLNGQLGTVAAVGGTSGAWTATVTLSVNPDTLGTWTSGNSQFVYCNYPNVPNGLNYSSAIGYGVNQQYTGTRVANNITIDGLVITGVWGMAAFFYGSSLYGLTGITLKNCDIYDCSGPENQNTGGPYFENTSGSQILGNCIHDMGYGLRETGGAFDIAGLWVWQSENHLIDSNTIYDCGCCVYLKSGPQQSYQFTRNMVECDPLYPCTCLRDGSESDDTGSDLTALIAHNILMPHGSQAFYGLMSDTGSNDIYQTTVAFNTIYSEEAGGLGVLLENGAPAGYPTGNIAGHYSNIYDLARNGALDYLKDFSCCALSQGSSSPYSFTTLAALLSDYNLYDGTSSTAVITVSPYSSAANPFTEGTLTLSGWQAAASLDAHSGNGSPTYQGALDTLGHANPQGFMLASGSLGSASSALPGSSNGTSGGTATDMGAYGNGNTSVGCGFTSNAPDRT